MSTETLSLRATVSQNLVCRNLQGFAGICRDQTLLQIIKRILHRLTGICRYLAGICRYLVGILHIYCRNLAGIGAISGIKRDVRQLMRVWIVFLSCFNISKLSLLGVLKLVMLTLAL